MGVESVFNALQGMELARNVLMTPSLEECNRYLWGTNAIVVRQLIGQSPLTIVDGCLVPRIEKILVDLVGDNELLFASDDRRRRGGQTAKQYCTQYFQPAPLSYVQCAPHSKL